MLFLYQTDDTRIDTGDMGCYAVVAINKIVHYRINTQDR